ncbi:MAG TPA: PEP/pyruvate-binding domain-containing protein [Thermoanaerobaculaceae bacterium]|nr:PEP/pyruvate-binding domain-containing protein [Thermoanaerobaculaceae bacterium]HRS14914.1 PEP/pyruvate-binding domain-containing protein [Thermoanaerobaculaceae bacterium]
MGEGAQSGGIQRFEREFFSPAAPFTFIGDGELGGKARGLAGALKPLALLDASRFEGITVGIPHLVVVTTSLFDAFMERNELWETALDELPDERIASAFMRAELPIELGGDLRALVQQVRQPLAVRSSSLLEDALGRPLAGIYATKMTPNNQLDADARFRKLGEAVKLVWASTFFRDAKSYRQAIGAADRDEKMAVVIQEVVGSRFGDRFYPHISGVGRSFNYYATGNAKPSDGVGILALGLGKTIVDGEPAWAYSPAYPKAPPPYTSIGELLKSTQTGFWAVNMGQVPYDPLAEAEYLVRGSLADAEADDTLRFVASTFDPQSNRITPSLSVRGPRLVNFAPVLSYGVAPVNEVLRELLRACEDEVGAGVEIELALVLDLRGGTPARCGFLQVRALAGGGEEVEVSESDFAAPDLVVASERVLGHGRPRGVRDVVYVKREGFGPALTPAVARELAELNARLTREHRPYLLIGFGRWGTSDPTGGVPVSWGQIAGARVIVEASLPAMRQEMSQGSHFFHNLTSLGVVYFSVGEHERPGIDWAWLESQPPAGETSTLRHLELAAPLDVRVDGRTGRGVVRHG